MKRTKAFVITMLIMSMLTLIFVGLFAMGIIIWKIFAIAFIIAGLYFIGNKCFFWIVDEGPLDCVTFDQNDKIEDALEN